MVLYTGFNGKVNKKLMVNYTTITCLSFHDNYMYPLRKMSNPDPCLEGRGVSLAFCFTFHCMSKTICASRSSAMAPRFISRMAYCTYKYKKAASETYCLQNSVFLLYPFVWIRLARLVSPTSAPA